MTGFGPKSLPRQFLTDFIDPITSDPTKNSRERVIKVINAAIQSKTDPRISAVGRSGRTSVRGRSAGQHRASSRLLLRVGAASPKSAKQRLLSVAAGRRTDVAWHQAVVGPATGAGSTDSSTRYCSHSASTRRFARRRRPLLHRAKLAVSTLSGPPHGRGRSSGSRHSKAWVHVVMRRCVAANCQPFASSADRPPSRSVRETPPNIART